MDVEIILDGPPGGTKRFANSLIDHVFRSGSGGPLMVFRRRGTDPVVKLTRYGPFTVDMSVAGKPRSHMEYKKIDIAKVRPDSDITYEEILNTEGRAPEIVSFERKVVERKTVVLSNCSFAVIKYHIVGVDPRSNATVSIADLEYMPELQHGYSLTASNIRRKTRTTFIARNIRTNFEPFEAK